MNLLDKFLQAGELEYTHKRLGLERVRVVLERLDHPERAYPSVLIAGTNGKGSVARMLETVMVAAGYPVGLYASPHVKRFTERIRVGGNEIEEEVLEQVLGDFLEQGLLDSEGRILVAGQDHLTWFEKVTVLAFEVFRRQKVPLAILEVGLGARLDATNVVDPIVSIITAIGHDHREVLGDSLFEIAKEKIAVMRKGKPLILAPMDPEVRNFLSKASRMEGAKPVIPHMPKGNWRQFSYGPFENLELGLAGRHQMGNAVTAIEATVALKEKGFEIRNAHIHHGLREARLPGRMEVHPGEPTILLDGAHNEEALQVLVDFIRQEYPKKPVTIILGMMQEKDPQRALQILAPLNANFVFTEAKTPRSIPLEQWEHLAGLMGEKIVYELSKDPQRAFELARDKTPPEGIIVLAGSIYMVGEVSL